MLSIAKVDNFPDITRQGRASEDLQKIIDALRASADNGDRFCIAGVEPGNAYNSMQQRIRAQAKKLNLKVIIRFDKDSGELYFKATRISNEKVAVQEMVADTDSLEDFGISASDAGAKVAKKRARS